MANNFTGRLKRKGSDDIEAEYCYGDVLASSKRFRLDPELPIFCGEQERVGIACEDIPMQIPELQNPVEIYELQQLAEPSTLAAEPLPFVPNDEKALVLYKPVNPPMFPGGPGAGSSDLPIKFNTNCHSNLKVWQIHGTGNLPDLFRLSRQSDFASDLKISEAKLVDNSLAVVPWVPSQFPASVQEWSSDKRPGCDNLPENEDQMIMDDENVVMMEEDPVQPPEPNITCNSVVNEMGTDGVQWQHCMTPQPPVNPPVMWSY